MSLWRSSRLIALIIEERHRGRAARLRAPISFASDLANDAKAAAANAAII